MVPVARKNLFADKVRFLISVGGVTLAVLLILVLQSLYQGFSKEAGSFVANMPADLWVGQQGVSDLFHSRSVLPDDLAPTIEETEGVDYVFVLNNHGQVKFQRDSGEVATWVMSIDPRSVDLPALENRVPAKGEIFVDTVLAKKDDISIGDVLEYGERTFTVAYIGKIGNVILSQYSFISPEDYLDLFGAPGIVNFYLVGLNDPSQSASVAQALENRLPDTTVLTRDKFTANSREVVTSFFLPILMIVVIVAFVVGLAVLGITIYTATIEKTREYGVMKAIGASAGYLFRMVVYQSLIVGVIGFALGVVFSFALNSLAGQFVPEFVTEIRLLDVLVVGGVAAVMSVLAALIPVRRVASIDPALVFRA